MRQKTFGPGFYPPMANEPLQCYRQLGERIADLWRHDLVRRALSASAGKIVCHSFFMPEKLTDGRTQVFVPECRADRPAASWIDHRSWPLRRATIEVRPGEVPLLQDYQAIKTAPDGQAHITTITVRGGAAGRHTGAPNDPRLALSIYPHNRLTVRLPERRTSVFVPLYFDGLQNYAAVDPMPCVEFPYGLTREGIIQAANEAKGPAHGTDVQFVAAVAAAVERTVSYHGRKLWPVAAAG